MGDGNEAGGKRYHRLVNTTPKPRATKKSRGELVGPLPPLPALPVEVGEDVGETEEATALSAVVVKADIWSLTRAYQCQVQPSKRSGRRRRVLRDGDEGDRTRARTSQVWAQSGREGASKKRSLPEMSVRPWDVSPGRPGIGRYEYWSTCRAEAGMITSNTTPCRDAVYLVVVQVEDATGRVQ